MIPAGEAVRDCVSRARSVVHSAAWRLDRAHFRLAGSEDASKEIAEATRLLAAALADLRRCRTGKASDDA